MGLRFSGGNVISRGVFVLFWPSLAGPGRCPNGPFFWLKVSLKTRSKYASIELLIDFLAYREWKLWLINQKLTKILLPQKPLWGAFLPGNNSPSDWARELFKPCKDWWRYVVCNEKKNDSVYDVCFCFNAYMMIGCLCYFLLTSAFLPDLPLRPAGTI